MRELNFATCLLVALALLCGGASSFKNDKNNFTCPLAIKTRIARRAKWNQTITYTVKVTNQHFVTVEDVHVAVKLPGHAVVFPLEEGTKYGSEYYSIRPRNLRYDSVHVIGNMLELWGATLPRKRSLTWRIKVRLGGCVRDPSKSPRFRARAFLFADGGAPSCFAFAPKSNVTVKNGIICSNATVDQQPHSSHVYDVVSLGMNLIDTPPAPASPDLTPSQRAYKDSLEEVLYAPDDSPYVEDPVVRGTSAQSTVSTQGVSGVEIFPGIPKDRINPPDPILAVGPNHVVHLVNTRIAIYDKSGNQVMAPRPINTLFDQSALADDDPCKLRNDGDPTADWDHWNQRFVVAQFTKPVPNHQCVAMSKTADPTGDWWVMSVPHSAQEFWDYPKSAVFRDGLVFTFDRFAPDEDGGRGLGSAIMLIDSAALANGQPARATKRTIDDLRAILPASTDVAGGFLPGPDYKMPLLSITGSTISLLLMGWNWDVGVSSVTLSGAWGELPLPGVAPFNRLCPNTDQCIPQPGNIVNDQKLDALQGRLMHPLRYNIMDDGQGGTYESMVVSHSVQVGNQGTHAGIRWYEIRGMNSQGGAWIKHQETFAPDEAQRWMPTIGMDSENNIAVLYSIVVDDLRPSLAIVGYIANENGGLTPTAETIVVTGTSFQFDRSRWGDYFAMALDPQDGCTLWGVGQTVDVSSGHWLAHLVKFTLQESC